jgi:hypothetical protein
MNYFYNIILWLVSQCLEVVLSALFSAGYKWFAALLRSIMGMPASRMVNKMRGCYTAAS